MRKSRVLLAGVAVAAAAAATSAFTASNTVPKSVAGYGQAEVTGAAVTGVHYVSNATDSNTLDAVEFTTTTNVTAATSTLTLRTGVAADDTGGTIVGAPYACTVKTPWDNTSMVITCDTTAATNGGTVRKFQDFNGVGLTVVS